MDQNFSDTQFPTTVTTAPSGSAISWVNPNNIKVDDVSSSTLNYTVGADSGASITADDFGLRNLPTGAIVDGVEVYIQGTNTGCYGTIELGGIAGTSSKDMATLNGSFGSSTDLWGLTVIDPADIQNLTVTVDTGDISGGDGIASIEYMTATVYWHLDLAVEPTDVPTRVAYKVYSRDGAYMGELPDVTSVLNFSQDINSAGSSIQISCAKYLSNEVIVDQLLTEADEVITTEADLDILTTTTSLVVAVGSSPDEVLFKNSNRIKVWVYNYWYPNGKLVFSGQVNRLSFGYGAGDSKVTMLVYSDGIDLGNYIARGLSDDYTTDVSQPYQSGAVGNNQSSTSGEWRRSGQTFTTGGAVTNVAAIVLELVGNATVTVSLYDTPNGTLLGSTSKTIANAIAAEVQFSFPQTVPVSAATEYFFAISVLPGQNIEVSYDGASAYSGGVAYLSEYSGGAGGSYNEYGGSLYFITKSGVLVTTTTFTSEDPVTGMMSPILQDYNNRGGYVVERVFEATGLSLTYLFNQSTIFDALQKVIELSPSGYYSFIDLGTAEMDIKEIPTTADFTVVGGRDVNQLDISFTIEQVKNYLLFSGGDVGGGINLFKYYQDTQSTSFYGIRTSTKSDNRVTLDATADAIGQTFIDESAGEVQETTLTVLNESIDITLLEPGKTIGFRNFGDLIDEMLLQIVRREYTPHSVKLTLGRLPISTSITIQKINRDLLLEQTINNPDTPT